MLRRAVRDRQRVPRGDLEITVDGVRMTVPRETAVRARDRARGLRRPHNVARKLFVTEVLSALAAAEAAALGRDLDPDDLPYARARLWDEPPVRAALNDLWPYLTPQRLVAGLLAEEGALRRAAPALSAAERTVLARPDAPDAWTVADVPLLDEAAQLLGSDDSADKRRRRASDRERRAEERYAREVLEITGVAEGGLVDAATLADWNRDPGQQLTTAERAWADPSWAYGHVIVDEAQELSAMAWRMVMRRIPTRSLTVVGDVAQRGSAAGARSWAQMLDSYVGGRWREERLTVNYRTPAEIMAVAGDVLAAVAPGEQPPESVREEGISPRAVKISPSPQSPSSPHTPQTSASRRPRWSPERSGTRRGDGATAASWPSSRPAARIGELARALPEAVPGDQAGGTGLAGRPAHRRPGQGPGVRPGGAGRPGRDPGPVTGRRPRPLRRPDPRHPPSHRRPRRRPPPSPLPPRPPTSRGRPPRSHDRGQKWPDTAARTGHDHETRGPAHEVLRALGAPGRVAASPAPGDDGLRIALVIEGGGMRGVISAGMALALDELGLVPAFDAVYGASAGAITGAWLLSRPGQACAAGRSPNTPGS